MGFNPIKKARRLISHLEGRVKTLETELTECRKAGQESRRIIRDLKKELGQ